MPGILEAGIQGLGVGAGIAAIYWVGMTVRRKVLGEAPPPEPLTRDEMIIRLQAMIDDPTTPPSDREKAEERLRAFDSLDQSE